MEVGVWREGEWGGKEKSGEVSGKSDGGRGWKFEVRRIMGRKKEKKQGNMARK